jgi:hypothetical protein
MYNECVSSHNSIYLFNFTYFMSLQAGASGKDWDGMSMAILVHKPQMFKNEPQTRNTSRLLTFIFSVL